jgi:hypothetical protein
VGAVVVGGIVVGGMVVVGAMVVGAKKLTENVCAGPAPSGPIASTVKLNVLGALLSGPATTYAVPAVTISAPVLGVTR